MTPLLALTPGELSEVVEGRGRARSVWRVLSAGGDPGSEPALSRPLRQKLNARTGTTRAEVDRRDVSACGTTKLRLRLADGAAIETVLIPSERRSTVCVSTQVGCARGCRFCVTATMGLVRGLEAPEIVAQVLAAIREAAAAGHPEVRNVVYMGMGEPLDQLEAVERSVAILCDRDGLALGPAHVTLSTVGTSPEAIRRAGRLPVRLAWSLHAAEDDLRRRLIPTARHPVRALRDAFAAVCRDRERSLFVEMTLIEGVNDAPEQADALCDFLALLPEVRVNLLPMNPGREGLSPSPWSRTLAFRQRVRERGLFCATRRPRGAPERAACGQLSVL